ncbi:MAG: hypothetical protein AB8F78_19765 [Saprospiraceae bacterium]
MEKKFAYYFIPIFMVIYFFVALLPVVTTEVKEIFPFFSFKLYSKIPNGCTNYDILFDKGLPSETFLIHENPTINRFERRVFSNRVKALRKQYEGEGNATSTDISDLLARGTTVHLVKLSGSCIDAAKDDKFDLAEIKQLK